MPPLAPLPDLMLEPLVCAALAEDLGRTGDVTSDALIPADQSLSSEDPTAGLSLSKFELEACADALTCGSASDQACGNC